MTPDNPWLFPVDPDVAELIESYDRLVEIVGDEKLPWYVRLRLWIEGWNEIRR